MPRFRTKKPEMTEYWLISAPGEKTCQQTWETMNNVTSKQNNLCINYKFHIPDLKVTLIYNFHSIDLEKKKKNSLMLFLYNFILIIRPYD